MLHKQTYTLLLITKLSPYVVYFKLFVNRYFSLINGTHSSSNSSWISLQLLEPDNFKPQRPGNESV